MAKQIDKSGFWYIEKNPLTKVGVFQYLGKQISPELEPDKIYNVFRPAEELFKPETMESFKYRPMYDEHSMVGNIFGKIIPPESKVIEGVIGQRISKSEDTLYGDLSIYGENIKNLIGNGKKELSVGYFCKYEKNSGYYKGQHYDFIQRDIIGNHLALVDNGRAGHEISVCDSSAQTGLTYCYDTIKEVNEAIKKQNFTREGKPMSDKLKKLLETLKGALSGKVDEPTIQSIVAMFEQIGTDEELSPEEKEKAKLAKDEEIKKADEAKKAQDEAEAKEKAEKEAKDCEVKAKDEEIKSLKQSLDEMPTKILEMVAKRDDLYAKVSKVVGTFDHSKMDLTQVAQYACDKLDIKEVVKGQEVSAVLGFLKASPSKQTVSMDSGFVASAVAVKKDEGFEGYMKGCEKPEV